jgi:putative acetyltransferase
MTRDVDFAEIRPEGADDARAVRALLLDAFETHAEADLVEALRAAGDLVLGLIAEGEEGVAGYAAFSRATLDGRAALALAPVAVRKGRRIEGVGSRLVRAGLRELEGRFAGQIVVLGDPLWYDRFGFRLAPHVSCRWAGPNLLALPLGEQSEAAGEMRYAPAFDAL